MSALLAAALAVPAGAGAALVVHALTAGEAEPSPAGSGSGGRAPARIGARAGCALGLGVPAYLVTGWPVAGLWLAVLGAALPGLAQAGRRRTAEAARLAAVAAWAEQLRDQVRAGADLSQALVASAGRAPAALAGPLARLGIRVRRTDPAGALAAFAEEVADPTADLVAAALALAFTAPARNLADLLGELAGAARAQAGMRLRVERDRARVRTVARGAGAVVIGWVAVVYLISGAFLDPYRSPVGQLVLAAAGALFAAGLAGLARLDRLPAAPRLRLNPAVGERSSR